MKSKYLGQMTKTLAGKVVEIQAWIEKLHDLDAKYPGALEVLFKNEVSAHGDTPYEYLGPALENMFESEQLKEEFDTETQEHFLSFTDDTGADTIWDPETNSWL